MRWCEIMGEALIWFLTLLRGKKNYHIVWWAITPNLKRKQSASWILDPFHPAGYRSFEGNGSENGLIMAMRLHDSCSAKRAVGLMDRSPQKLRWKKDIESYYDKFGCQMVQDSLHQQYDPQKGITANQFKSQASWESTGAYPHQCQTLPRNRVYRDD